MEDFTIFFLNRVTFDRNVIWNIRMEANLKAAWRPSGSLHNSVAAARFGYIRAKFFNALGD